jgi:hypothetical protein
MLDRKLPALSLLLAAGLFLAPAALAAPLPSGLEDNCEFAGCDIAYWAEEDGGTGHYYAFVPTEATLSWSDAQALAAASSLGSAASRIWCRSRATSRTLSVANVLPGAGTIGHKQQVWIGHADRRRDQVARARPGLGVDHARDLGLHQLAAGRAERRERQPHRRRALSRHVGALLPELHDRRGTWNDEDLVANAQSPLLGMIIEFEAGTVPEPATLALFALGAGLLALTRHARRV